MIIIFSSTGNEASDKARLIVLFIIRAIIVIFVAIRLIYYCRKTTPNPPKASLFALNLVRLLFIFVWLVLDGPVYYANEDYTVIFIDVTIMIIIVLILTSVKIEYPDVQVVRHVPTTNATVFMAYLPTTTVNTTNAMGHVPGV